MQKDLFKNQIVELQNLVSEMMKENPDELMIKKLMKSLDLKYESDPIKRITYVLDCMNNFVTNREEKKVEYDL